MRTVAISRLNVTATESPGAGPRAFRRGSAREEVPPGDGERDRGDAAQDDRRHGREQRRGRARLERASNELGAFESGAAAALLGAVPAVVLGGIATIALAAAWSRLFPELTRVGRLEDLRPRDSVGVTFKPLMATVRIPPILRPEAGNNRQVEIDGETVREVLESLVATYPPLRERIFDESDELPQFLNVFIDGTDIRLDDGLETKVGRARP